jgi:hypothetical protein
MNQFEIVWRNALPRRLQRRCVPLQIESDRRLYLIEELIRRGDRLHWNQAAALEMVYGNRATS